MKIISLKSENVLRLQAVEVTPEGNVIVVRGENAQGKSSVLDSIILALAGGARIPPEVIHRGAKRGSVDLDLGEYTVRRKFSRSGSELEVRTADGVKVSSPQALLDKITGKLCFDPMSFVRLGKKERAEVLRSVAGVDLADLDARRAAAYEARTEANREVASRGAQLKSRPPVPGVPPGAKETSYKELLDEQALLLAVREENARLRKCANELVARALQIQGEEVEEHAEVARLEAELAEAKRRVAVVAAEAVTAMELRECALCGWPVAGDLDAPYARLRRLTRDHIIPRSRGGTDHPSNIRWMCNTCNSRRGNAISADDLALIQTLPPEAGRLS